MAEFKQANEIFLQFVKTDECNKRGTKVERID